jgi:inosine/xanthosine triphosphatase
MVKLVLGSTNIAKVQALEETVRDYPHLAGATVVSLSVPSDVTDQPLSLEETIQGANNRAKNAFEASHPCSYGIGVESGLCTAPGTETGFLHVSVCSIFNGTRYYAGLSTGFEIPPAILTLLTDKKLDLSQACIESGITTNHQIGSTEGLIGILTKGRIDRKEYSKQAIRSAFIQLECAEWYR